jgi:hypothetical protein
MKNNKGFTIVELLSTFILSSIIIMLLFQLIINLKEIYQSSGIKTELLNKQYIITNKIYTDLNEKQAVKIDNCDSSLICVDFTYSDGSIKRFEADDINKTISYDDSVIALTNGSYFDDINITTSDLQTDEKIFNMNIPIYNTLLKNENFGINIIYQYNQNETTNNYGTKIIPPLTQYTYIPYIKSNGEQYINLGYKAKTNTEIRLDIELIENANTNTDHAVGNNLIGFETYNAAMDNFAVNFGGNANQKNIIYYWVDKTYESGAQVYSKTYDSVISRSTMIVKSDSATFQGETRQIATKTGNNTANMLLLSSFAASTSKIERFDRYDTKVYGFQIYEGNTIIKNLIPAKRNTDDKIGLYDIINNTFYLSDGSSDFIYE